MRGAVCAWIVLCSAVAVVADDRPPTTPENSVPAPVSGEPASTAGGLTLQIQEFDDPVTTLQPVKPRTAALQRMLESAAWFATGRVLEGKNDFQGALTAFKKAIELDPTALAAYKALIPLCFSLNMSDDAIKYALKAVELDPGDYQLLRRLGAHQAGQNDFEGAIKLFEQAVRSPELQKHSALYVTLMRDLAVLYKATNQNDQAARCFEPVFEALQDPETYHLDFRTRAQLVQDPSTTYEKMGQVFLDAKRSELAIQAFQKAAESKKGNSGSLSFNLAQVYLQSDEAQKAHTELQKYFDTQRQSKGRSAYELLASILKKLGKSDQLIPQLEILAEKDTRNSTLQFFLADQYLAKNRLDDAEKLYRKTLETSAELQGYVGLAKVYRQQKRPAELIGSLAKAYDESGEVKGLQTEIKAIAGDEELLGKLMDAGSREMQGDPPKLDFAGAYVLANIAAEAHDPFSMTKFYRFALSLRKERAALVFEELGQYYLENKQFAEAAKIFAEASNHPELGDNKPNFLFQLAQALEFAGDTKGALQSIAAARQIIPEHPLLQFQEAWVYYHSHQYEEAIERFEKLISQYSQNRQIVRRAQFSLSNIYVMQGNMRKGEQILEDVLAESPNDPSVNNDLGYLYADQGKNLDKAESMIRKALAAEPENGAYLDSMGWVLYKQGKYKESLPYLERAVDRAAGISDETLWDHLGDVLHRLEQPEKALDAWQHALKSAQKASRPDEKLIGRLKEKIKQQQADAGALKPAQANSP